MAETNYKPNSEKSKELPAKVDKKIEKVVKGNVTTRKKSLGGKLADTFVADDAGNVKNYIFLEVLVPAIKSAISDMVSTGIEMLLYGESRGRGRKGGSHVSYRYDDSRTSYTRYYEDRDRRESRDSRRDEGRSGYEDIIFDSRNDAEDVLCRMFEVIDKYDAISVQDLYEMVGKRSVYTDDYWGWEDLTNASVSRIHEGYLLKLPRPKYLK